MTCYHTQLIRLGLNGKHLMFPLTFMQERNLVMSSRFQDDRKQHLSRSLLAMRFAASQALNSADSFCDPSVTYCQRYETIVLPTAKKNNIHTMF